jgi:hypothetical protein
LRGEKMAYKVANLTSSGSPYNQSTTSTTAVGVQMDTHSAAWINSSGDFDGKAWVFGTIQSDPNDVGVLCPWSINETGSRVRTQYGSSFWNTGTGGLVYMDDAVVAFASTVRWTNEYNTYNNILPKVNKDRSRINAIRVQL